MADDMTLEQAYCMLGVPTGASVEEVKTAYRKASMQSHPDKPGGDSDKQVKLNRAYDLISTAHMTADLVRIQSRELMAKIDAVLAAQNSVAAAVKAESVRHRMTRPVRAGRTMMLFLSGAATLLTLIGDKIEFISEFFGLDKSDGNKRVLALIAIVTGVYALGFQLWAFLIALRAERGHDVLSTTRMDRLFALVGSGAGIFFFGLWTLIAVYRHSWWAILPGFFLLGMVGFVGERLESSANRQ